MESKFYDMSVTPVIKYMYRPVVEPSSPRQEDLIYYFSADRLSIVSTFDRINTVLDI